ncbi:MAG: nitrate reductase [Humidesulfovibrio sp.]|nr:nitrate reductase [Humidesulfovibrio sp.]
MTLLHVYDFAAGPLFAFSCTVFVLGSLWRVLRFVLLARAADPAALKGFRPAWALKSILHWLLPANITARVSPLMTLAGFAFHLALIAVALCFSAHVILWDQAWSLSWWTLPDEAADWLTYLFLAAAAFLAGRRLALPHVRALTTPSDWLVLALTVAPMLTGLMAFRQWGDYDLMITLHVLSGNLMLLAVPFTKLSHAVLFFVSRAVTGSDFGKRSVGAW